MTPEVIKTLDTLENEEILKEFYFIGGTALSYYLQHRISYDLDFISLSRLKQGRLKTLTVNYGARYIPESEASAFRINTGEDLVDYIMKFNLDGVKLEFFYSNDPVRDSIVKKYKDQSFQIRPAIRILPLECLALLKTIAFFKRKKIRDIFDVFVLYDQNILSLELLENLFAQEIGKKTFLEYILDFKDDGTESIDIHSESLYFRQFSEFTSSDMLNEIKNY